MLDARARPAAPEAGAFPGLRNSGSRRRRAFWLQVVARCVALSGLGWLLAGNPGRRPQDGLALGYLLSPRWGCGGAARIWGRQPGGRAGGGCNSGV